MAVKKQSAETAWKIARIGDAIADTREEISTLEAGAKALPAALSCPACWSGDRRSILATNPRCDHCGGAGVSGRDQWLRRIQESAANPRCDHCGGAGVSGRDQWLQRIQKSIARATKRLGDLKEFKRRPAGLLTLESQFPMPIPDRDVEAELAKMIAAHKKRHPGVPYEPPTLASLTADMQHRENQREALVRRTMQHRESDRVCLAALDAEQQRINAGKTPKDLDEQRAINHAHRERMKTQRRRAEKVRAGGHQRPGWRVPMVELVSDLARHFTDDTPPKRLWSMLAASIEGAYGECRESKGTNGQHVYHYSYFRGGPDAERHISFKHFRDLVGAARRKLKYGRQANRNPR